MELGEARFIAVFLGSYDTVKTIRALGCGSHAAYVRAFERKLAGYAKAGYILREDADAMARRAALCPPLTYTERYRAEHPLVEYRSATACCRRLRRGKREGIVCPPSCVSRATRVSDGECAVTALRASGGVGRGQRE